MYCDLPSTSALITLPSADSDRLILVASCKAADKAREMNRLGEALRHHACMATPSYRPTHVSEVCQPSPKPSQICTHASDHRVPLRTLSRSPVAPVLLCRSLPARSTRLSLPTRMCWFEASLRLAHSTMMVKMECDRDDVWFISVAPTERFFLPACGVDQMVLHQGGHWKWEGRDQKGGNGA